MPKETKAVSKEILKPTQKPIKTCLGYTCQNLPGVNGFCASCVAKYAQTYCGCGKAIPIGTTTCGECIKSRLVELSKPPGTIPSGYEQHSTCNGKGCYNCNFKGYKKQ